MLKAGGLIKMHYHDHYEVLESFYDVDGVLYYREKPLFLNITISPNEHNYLTKLENGLFVDGTFLDRFSYENDELLFDNIIVSREYEDQKIQDMVTSLFNKDTFHEIGKIDLNRFFETISIQDTELTYKNNSDMDMTLAIINPTRQTLVIVSGENTDTNNMANITYILHGGKTIDIQEINGEILNDITVKIK